MALWGAGFGALGWGGWFYASAALGQAAGQREFAELESGQTPRSLQEGSIIGRLKLPDGKSVVVFEGTTEDQLWAGVGHVMGTSVDLDQGNIALAAHRDTFFRLLQNVHSGDRIGFSNWSGKAEYQVSWTSIVHPDALDVLRPTPEPSLTLITCYPFEFFGHAPERFVVRATRVSRENRH